MIAHQKQQGVALLSVMLIVSVLIFISTEVLVTLKSNTRKTAFTLDQMQARHYAMGAEQYVIALLEEDFLKDQGKATALDSLDENWNVQRVSYEVGQGDIQITVVDEQGKLNVNNLTDASDNASVTMVKNLLKHFAMDERVAFLIRDWVDSNQQLSPQGAEDNQYLMMPEPYRTGDRHMASLSELAALTTVTLHRVRNISSVMTALPEKTHINLNTASEKVLLSLSDQLSKTDVKAIVDLRSGAPLTTLDDLKMIPSMNSKVGLLNKLPVGFSSQFYSALIKVQFQSAQFQMKTLLYRKKDGIVQVAAREVGPDYHWPLPEHQPESPEG
ncbi:type II secretion system minor pseudopilin GspK [Endozoicomonas acroporae]|uniref:type II secretion system minor pseudopilin GspK n=1 Tax=Endozoicomonas acroporae TaxID=1701104 RepID=UPI003D7920BE